MKILQRCYFGAGLFFFLVLAAWCCRGALPQSVWDSWNPFDLLEQSRREDRRSLELDAQREILWRHFESKRALVADMAAGRRSLWEAVRLLRAQGGITPRFLKQVHVLYPGTSDDEALGRNLILFTTGILNEDPTQAAVIARLEAELARGPRHGDGKFR